MQQPLAAGVLQALSLVFGLALALGLGSGLALGLGLGLALGLLRVEVRFRVRVSGVMIRVMFVGAGAGTAMGIVRGSLMAASGYHPACAWLPVGITLPAHGHQQASPGLRPPVGITQPTAASGHHLKLNQIWFMCAEI